MKYFTAKLALYAMNCSSVGEELAPFNGDFNADAINGPDILDDLVNQAAR